MASNNKQLKNAKTAAANEDQPEQNSSLTGSIIRYALVAALGFYLLKPYFFDKPKLEMGRQNFAVHGETMGTTWNAIICATPSQLVEINSNSPNDEETVDSCEILLSRLIQKELDKIDSLASTYKTDSDVSKFNRSESTDWFDVAPEVAEIVTIAQEVAKETNGAFDVTVAPLVNLYRFGPNKSPLTELPSEEKITAILQEVGYDKLEARMEPKPGLKKTNANLTVDLSGVAKGFAADKVGKALENVGLNSYMIEVGGEIRLKGQKVDAETLKNKPWTLAIQTPEVSSTAGQASQHAPQMYRFLRFSSEENSGALATSGDYHNYLQVGELRFSHIIDPRSGKPTEIIDQNAKTDKSLGSVSIVSTSCDEEISCAKADAYATAFFVLGAEEGLALAEKLNIPVLFLFREDDSANLAGLTEVASSAFTQVGSKTLDEIQNEEEEEPQKE